MSKDRKRKKAERKGIVSGKGISFFFSKYSFHHREDYREEKVVGKRLAFTFSFIIRERRKGGETEKGLECRQETFSVKQSSSFK